MTPEELSQLERLFDAADVGWIFVGEDSAARADGVRAAMEDVERALVTKGVRPASPLLDQLRGDATGLKPLIQSFASPMTAEMRAMIYCVLKGASVTRLSVEYQQKQRVHLDIELELQPGKPATFSSDELWDVEVLRHFGLMKLGGRPVIDGYYAFQKGP